MEKTSKINGNILSLATRIINKARIINNNGNEKYEIRGHCVISLESKDNSCVSIDILDKTKSSNDIMLLHNYSKFTVSLWKCPNPVNHFILQVTVGDKSEKTTKIIESNNLFNDIDLLFNDMKELYKNWFIKQCKEKTFEFVETKEKNLICFDYDLTKLEEEVPNSDKINVYVWNKSEGV